MTAANNLKFIETFGEFAADVVLLFKLQDDRNVATTPKRKKETSIAYFHQRAKVRSRAEVYKTKIDQYLKSLK